jgi:hypothetical protein
VSLRHRRRRVLRARHGLRLLPEGRVREPGGPAHHAEQRALSTPPRTCWSTSTRGPRALWRRHAAPREPDAAHARPRDARRPEGRKAASARSARRRTSTRTSGSSRPTSSRTPCSPGSLGIEAMLPAPPVRMLEQGHGRGHAEPALRADRHRAPAQLEVPRPGGPREPRHRLHHGGHEVAPTGRARRVRPRRRVALGRRQAHLRRKGLGMRLVDSSRSRPRARAPRRTRASRSRPWPTPSPRRSRTTRARSSTDRAFGSSSRSSSGGLARGACSACPQSRPRSRASSCSTLPRT